MKIKLLARSGAAALAIAGGALIFSGTTAFAADDATSPPSADAAAPATPDSAAPDTTQAKPMRHHRHRHWKAKKMASGSDMSEEQTTAQLNAQQLAHPGTTPTQPDVKNSGMNNAGMSDQKPMKKWRHHKKMMKKAGDSAMQNAKPDDMPAPNDAMKPDTKPTEPSGTNPGP